MPGVFVGPSIWRQIHVRTATAIMTAVIDNPSDEHVIYAPIWNDALIGRSRSLMCTAFLETDCDVMVIIDDDIVFDPADFWKIVEGCRDTRGIYGGAYVTRSTTPHISSRAFPDGKEQVFRAGPVRRPIEYQYLATGFFALHRDVMERMTAPGVTFEDAYGRHGMEQVQLGANRPFWPVFSPFVCREDDGRLHYLSEDWAFPLDPETPVLDGAFRWRPLRDFRVGDTVIAVDEKSPSHSARRYRTALVEGVVKKHLPAWRIIHEDGEFITTGEHPWLVKRSWRKSVGYHNGSKIEPPGKWTWTPTAQIRVGDCLARVMPSEPNADITSEDYRAGYLQGVMQGDGHVGRRQHHAFLKMADREPLERAAAMFAREGIATKWQPSGVVAKAHHRPIQGFTVPKRDVPQVEAIMMDDQNTSRDFALGYLAGIYDAEGHYDGATIDIAQRDPAIHYRIQEMGHRAGFEFKADHRRVRLTGQDNVFRFWMATQPAMRRKMSLHGQAGPKEANHRPVRVLSVEPIGEEREVHCLVTSTGTFIANGIATHNCNRWRQLGGKVWVDLSVILQHMGEYPYTVADLKTLVEPGLPSSGIDVMRANGTSKSYGDPLIDEEMADLAEFSGDEPGDMRRMCAMSKDQLYKLWLSRSEKEEDWYRREDVGYHFLGDLAHWHRKGFGLLPSAFNETLAGKTVLDFGAGSGVAALRMAAAGATVYALEPNPIMRQFMQHRARKRGIDLHVVEELADVPAVDAVMSWHVFEHLEEPERVLDELLERLKDDGILITQSGFADASTPMHHVMPPEEWDAIVLGRGMAGSTEWLDEEGNPWVFVRAKVPELVASRG